MSSNPPMTEEEFGLEPIARGSVQGEVYARLRDAIQSGALHSASDRAISLRQVAQALNVSTTPVREALRQLEAQGLVTIKSRSGVIINHMSVDEFAEVTEMRLMLEPLILRKAVARLTEADTSQLCAVLDQLDTVADIRRWRSLNHEFHFGIYAKAESQKTLSIVEILWNTVEPYIRLYTLNADLAVAKQEHRAILAALVDQDEDRGAETLTEHIRRSGQALLSRPDVYGLLT